MYEEAFLEGYMDALNEIISSNPLPIIGGGDPVNDLLAVYGLGNGPERAAAIKNYFDNGGLIKGGLLGRTYGTENGMLYRKNRWLPGKMSPTENSDYENFNAFFIRLKPRDRKKIMDEYKKSLKKRK